MEVYLLIMTDLSLDCVARPKLPSKCQVLVQMNCTGAATCCNCPAMPNSLNAVHNGSYKSSMRANTWQLANMIYPGT